MPRPFPQVQVRQGRHGGTKRQILHPSLSQIDIAQRGKPGQRLGQTRIRHIPADDVIELFSRRNRGQPRNLTAELLFQTPDGRFGKPECGDFAGSRSAEKLPRPEYIGRSGDGGEYNKENPNIVFKVDSLFFSRKGE